MNQRHRLVFLILIVSLLVSLLPATGLAASPGGEADGVLSGGEVIPQAGMNAAGVLPSMVFDPDSTAWASSRNYSSASFADWFDGMKGENMLIDIEVDEFGGQQPQLDTVQDQMLFLPAVVGGESRYASLMR